MFVTPLSGSDRSHKRRSVNFLERPRGGDAMRRWAARMRRGLTPCRLSTRSLMCWAMVFWGWSGCITLLLIPPKDPWPAADALRRLDVVKRVD
jgi:hypothetical protein